MTATCSSHLLTASVRSSSDASGSAVGWSCHVFVPGSTSGWVGSCWLHVHVHHSPHGRRSARMRQPRVPASRSGRRKTGTVEAPRVLGSRSLFGRLQGTIRQPAGCQLTGQFMSGFCQLPALYPKKTPKLAKAKEQHVTPTHSLASKRPPPVWHPRGVGRFGLCMFHLPSELHGDALLARRCQSRTRLSGETPDAPMELEVKRLKVIEFLATNRKDHAEHLHGSMQSKSEFGQA